MKSELSLQLPSPGLVQRLFRVHRLQAERYGRDRPPSAQRGRRGPLRNDLQGAQSRAEEPPRAGRGLGGAARPAPTVPALPAATAFSERRAAAVTAPPGSTGNGVSRGRWAGAERQDGGRAVWAGRAVWREVAR